MGLCCKFAIIISVVGLAVLLQTFFTLTTPPKKPSLDINEYWGPGLKTNYIEKEDTSIVSNKFFYENEVITELKQRLNRTEKLHAPLEGVNFEYGFNSNRLKEILKYWRDNYLPRWRERELYLWKFPQLTTYIQGLQLHFIQTKVDEKIKKKKNVYPVLLLHGWPGSIREFYDFIPHLIDGNEEHDYVFEVVAPSLPGYGWSQASSKPGFGPAQMAVVLRNLMIRLGYNKFFIQGGDWGSLIGSNIATLFPENVLGYHSNMCVANTPISNLKWFLGSLHPPLFLEQEHIDFHYPIGKIFTKIIEETGYMHIQATKPDTIGTVLTDNPVGLAAYILEKFSTWTNLEYRKLPDGGFETDFKLDTLLDNIMIYYLTNSITTSQRLYAEAFTNEQRSLGLERIPVEGPVGCSRFMYDLMHSTDWQLKEKYPNLIHSTYHKNGGHFAAMQLPEVLYKDFIDFVKKVGEKK